MSPWLFNVYMEYGWCGSRGECKGTWEMAGVAKCEWWQVRDKPSCYLQMKKH